MEQECDRFDTELLIDEVEKRPVIWDMTSADYKDRVAKKRCWEEVVDVFCRGDTQEKKNVGEWTEQHFILLFLFLNIHLTNIILHFR